MKISLSCIPAGKETHLWKKQIILSAEILNELIEKIVIHQQEKIDGKKTQEIDIYYRGVGIISFPVSTTDIEVTINKILNRKKA